ncbi:MAG TPA: peptidoglycan DD-metalloendopeptidase family protein [Gemmatimonadaceae bacterium]|jgi:septal ring factor EnvC (AmiA/AmiB activator)|nr:peptidoglycan DD-metalloendopeptidase family protein [Gemmatimonadaceae bacterium]
MRAVLLAGIAIALASALLPGQQSETPEARVNAQRDELARIRAERDELEQKMSGLQNTAHELRDEVNLLDKQHDATARMVKSLDTQLDAITDEVTTTTADLQSSEREAAVKRAVLQRRLIEIYKRGPLYSAEVLFSAQSVGQLVARYKYLHLLALRDKGLVQRLEELHEKIESQQIQLVRLQSSVAENRTQKEQEAARLAVLEDLQSRNLVRVQQDTKRTKARLAELEKSEARLNNVIASFEAERRRASGRAGAPALSPSSIRTTDIGRLDWPVNGVFLYRFGRFVNPNNTTTRWNGIGISAPAGTPVKSVSGGTVAYAGPMGTYGNTVILEHGGGDYSVYGSLDRIDVRKGSRVVKGQAIGTVGVSDPALGSHLHFEIRRGGPAVDPAEWLRAVR